MIIISDFEDHPGDLAQDTTFSSVAQHVSMQLIYTIHVYPGMLDVLCSSIKEQSFVLGDKKNLKNLEFIGQSPFLASSTSLEDVKGVRFLSHTFYAKICKPECYINRRMTIKRRMEEGKTDVHSTSWLTWVCSGFRVFLLITSEMFTFT